MPTKGKGRVKPKVFSELSYKRLDRAYKAQAIFRDTCEVCGFKVRGPGHEQGHHHRIKHPDFRAAKGG